MTHVECHEQRPTPYVVIHLIELLSSQRGRCIGPGPGWLGNDTGLSVELNNRYTHEPRVRPRPPPLAVKSKPNIQAGTSRSSRLSIRESSSAAAAAASLLP
jgi:hypothetical protein